MGPDIKHLIVRCLPCIKHETVQSEENPAISLPTVRTNDRVQLDLVFGLPEDSKGYVGVIIITDATSKFPFASPIRSKTMLEIKRKFWQYITIFGPPKEIITDQGKEFRNMEFQDLTDICGIEHRVTSPYKPMTNGFAERFNQTLIKFIRKHAEENPKEWAEWLPYVLLP